MGDRADFYFGRGKDAKWLCSIAWDGYPSSVPLALRAAKTKAQFEEALRDFLKDRQDVTMPCMGWPWPWPDSKTTDYAYAFDGDRVWISRFGRRWLEAETIDEEIKPDPWEDRPKDTEFPDMTAIQKVAFDRRSGLMFMVSR